MARNARFSSPEPFQKFHNRFFEQGAPVISHALIPPTSNSSRQGVQSNTCDPMPSPSPQSNAVVARQPPFNPMSQVSAAAASQHRAHPSGLNAVSLMPPPASQVPVTDSLPKAQPLMSRFKTVTQKPTEVSAVTIAASRCHTGMANRQSTTLSTLPATNVPIETSCQKRSSKRLLEAPSISEGRLAKRHKFDGGPLPPHDSFPRIVDDGTKPGHSYAMLIGMAILRSPQRRLTLSQIYKWISDNFSFYNPNDAGWQNSIRHNLSLNKNFIKHERPKDDPGKGNYWAIEPGMEYLFMKDKSTRKSATVSDNLSAIPTHPEPSLLAHPAMHEPRLPAQLPPAPASVITNATSTPQAGPFQPEPSSDATIPVSDHVAAEESLDATTNKEQLTDSNGYSPLGAAMHSSPPIPRHLEPLGDTPPPVARRRGSSGAKSHKRKFASMDDSGYISSLESSVLRSRQTERLSTVETDRPRIKRGRAEEEIARLRASSYESPTKTRSWSGFVPQSSSPLRQSSSRDACQMLPPLTPAVKLAPPPRPPPSVSPNTNLRLHRAKVQRMVDSPLRRVLDIPEEVNPWDTPTAYDFDPSVYGFGFGADAGGVTDFDIFQDSPIASVFPSADDGSPVKRSGKRPHLERPQSTGVLGEITNTASRRSLTSGPSLKASRRPMSILETPSKTLMSLASSPSKIFLQSPGKFPDLTSDLENSWLNMDNMCSTTDLLEEPSDFPGVDITQGFDKIGQPSHNFKHSVGKPGLGRSFTSNS